MSSIYGYWLILIILIQQRWSDYSHGNHWTCCNNVVLTTYTHLCGDVSKQWDLSVEMFATLQTFFNPKSIWDTPFGSLLENEYVYVYYIWYLYIYIHIYQIIHHIYNVCRYQTNCLHWFQKIAKSSRHWGNFQGWHHVPTFMAWDCHRMVCSERLSSPETWKNPNKNDWNDFS